MASTSEAPWTASVLKGCAGVLGDTDTGLTGTELSVLLNRLRFPDPNPSASKRNRLEAAFLARQQSDGNPRRIITFIRDAMSPASYVRSPEQFTLRQDGLNEVLTFVGLRVTDKGQVAHGAASTTLGEAARHATALHQELRRRSTHQSVLDYCTLELLQKNNFHASLEATKSVLERLREMTGMSGDGAALVTKALSLGQSGRPVLAINGLRTQTERDEQTGFVNLLTGLCGMYRNLVAHDPRAKRTVGDQELLELVTTLSMVHRRLDEATTP